MDQTRNIEKSIGEQISTLRKIKKYTQKKFAEVLTDHGLSVDSSAVSRLEKGERALKISECMIVAEALDVELTFLLRGVQTPAQELKETRSFADFCMRDMSQSFADWLSSLLIAKWQLEKHPDLLANVSKDVTSHDEYLPWVAANLSKLEWEWDAPDMADAYILTRDQGEVEDLVACLVAYARSRIKPDEYVPGDA